MLSTSGYERTALDFYPTPASATEALLSVIGDDVPSFLLWEPFCGDGAISKLVGPLAREIVSTDINSYPGFEADGLLDFFKLESAEEVTPLKGFIPDAIITNPPYGKDAERAARHALALMEPEKGFVAFLCRHEWDSAKGRADLFDHPAFSMKITLRHRPRWIAGSEGAPRHNYSWYCWNWSKALLAPKMKAEIHYAK